ncbi:unnamed protein product [Rhizophagus irregularis]|nr:unnamed protein product [Rhizophagus irregularis]
MVRRDRISNYQKQRIWYYETFQRNTAFRRKYSRRRKIKRKSRSFRKTIEELDDKGIKEEIFEKICKNCYEKELKNLEDENELDDETETKKRLDRLKNLIKVLEIEVSDGELLISMEYRDVDILSADFIKLFQEYKNESEKEIKRILDEYLKKFEIEENEEEIEEENDDTDNSEKIGEILDPEEHEI